MKSLTLSIDTSPETLAILEKILSRQTRIKKLNTAELSESSVWKYIGKLHQSRSIILFGCDLRCDLERCKKRFLFIKSYNNLPILKITPVIPKKSRFVFIPVCLFEGERSSFPYAHSILAILHHYCDLQVSLSKKDRTFKSFHKIVQVQKTIQEQRKKLKLPEICAKLGCSAFWLSREFRRLCGIAFKDYQRRILMCEALRKIIFYDEQIKAVAYELGYKPIALIKNFKQIFGCTPGWLRRAI